MTTINIPNFEHYLIFEDGVIINSNTGNMMTPQIDPESGYTRMLLSSKFNKQKGLYLHRLLGLTFLPNPHNYPQIDHIDRDTSNKKITPLELKVLGNGNLMILPLGFMKSLIKVNEQPSILKLKMKQLYLKKNFLRI